MQRNLNEAVLNLTVIVERLFPRRRHSDAGQSLRAAARDVCHHALTVQLGDGDPRDLVKLALQRCGEEGVPLQNVADLINAFQEGHSLPVKKAS